jgi:hypothetical protein
VDKYLKCYYCEFETEKLTEYEQHVEREHPSFPAYPSKKYIQRHGLKSQNKFAENLPCVEDLINPD